MHLRIIPAACTLMPIAAAAHSLKVIVGIRAVFAEWHNMVER